MELDVQPGHVEDQPLDVQEGHIAAPAPSKFSRAINTRVPGLADVSEAGQSLANDTQQAAEGVAERVAQRTGSPLAGVAAGAPGAAASSLVQLGSELVPTKVKDVAAILMLEGAGRLGTMAAGGEGALAKAAGAAARGVAGAVVGGGVGGRKGAIAGGVVAAAAPAGLRKFITETPLTEIQQRSLAAAKELGIPAFLDDVVKSPAARTIGAVARGGGETADALVQAETNRANQLAQAKTDLLRELGPGGSPEAVGTAVQKEVQDKLATVQSKRLSDYGAAREGVAGQFPAPALPEGRSSAILKSAESQQASAKAVRKGLYDFADSALEAPPSQVQVPAAEYHNAAQEVLQSFGGKPIKTNDAYRMARVVAAGGQEGLAAEAEAKALLDEKVSQAARGLQQLTSLGVKNIEQNPAMLSKFPQPIQEAFNNRGLGAARAAQGDVSTVMSRPDLAAQLSPGAKAALDARGTVTLEQLNSHIRELGDAAESHRLPNGDYDNTGRQLSQMQQAARQMRSNFFAEQNPVASARQKLADVFHADYADTFRARQVQALYNRDPLGVFESVVRGGSAAEMKTLSKAVGPAGQPILKRQLFDMVFGDGSKIPSEVEITKNFAQFGPAIRTLYSGSELAGLRSFTRTGELPQFLQSAYESRLREIADKNPGQVISQLTSGEGDALLARAVKRYTKPETFARLGRMIADGILTPTADIPEKGGRGLSARVNAYSDRFLQTFYDPATVRRMRLIGDASQLLPGYGDLASRPPSPATSAITIDPRVGAVISPWGLTKGLFRGTVADVVPFVIPRDKLLSMYTSPSPENVRLLTTALRLPQMDPRWPRVLARIAELGYLHHVSPSKQNGSNATIAPQK